MIEAMTHKYPYTDFHDLNLDWVINKIHEIDTKVETIYNDAAADILALHLDKLLPDALYDADNHRLVLHVDTVIVGSGDHVYSPSEESITIEEV